MLEQAVNFSREELNQVISKILAAARTDPTIANELTARAEYLAALKEGPSHLNHASAVDWLHGLAAKLGKNEKSSKEPESDSEPDFKKDNSAGGPQKQQQEQQAQKEKPVDHLREAAKLIQRYQEDFKRIKVANGETAEEAYFAALHIELGTRKPSEITDEEIKKAYRKLLKAGMHPDLWGIHLASIPQGKGIFNQIKAATSAINRAKTDLLDKNERRSYDQNFTGGDGEKGQGFRDKARDWNERRKQENARRDREDRIMQLSIDANMMKLSLRELDLLSPNELRGFGGKVADQFELLFLSFATEDSKAITLIPIDPVYPREQYLQALAERVNRYAPRLTASVASGRRIKIAYNLYPERGSAGSDQQSNAGSNGRKNRQSSWGQSGNAENSWRARRDENQRQDWARQEQDREDQRRQDEEEKRTDRKRRLTNISAVISTLERSFIDEARLRPSLDKNSATFIVNLYASFVEGATKLETQDAVGFSLRPGMGGVSGYMCAEIANLINKRSNEGITAVCNPAGGIDVTFSLYPDKKPHNFDFYTPNVGEALRVQRTDGSIDTGWVVQKKFYDQRNVLQVVLEKNGASKTVPIENLSLLNKRASLEDISRAQNFLQLFDVLRRLGRVTSSRTGDNYPAEYLITSINGFIVGREEAKKIPRAGGLRDKVEELLKASFR